MEKLERSLKYVYLLIFIFWIDMVCNKCLPCKQDLRTYNSEYLIGNYYINTGLFFLNISPKPYSSNYWHFSC